uniref:Receptor protein-tyrosine kinase n=1 Tax=Magallana gigas TaxID=29159 RepID=A0A8W8MD80_MAGGI
MGLDDLWVTTRGSIRSTGLSLETCEICPDKALCLYHMYRAVSLQPTQAAARNTCYRWRTKCVWQWGCRYRTWSACCAWGFINVEVRYQEYYCCFGWRHNGNEVCNIPICPYDCGGSRGSCISPGVCRCNAGYTGTYCTTVPTDKAYYPSIEQSTLDLGYYHQVKGMLIYNMTIDSAMSPDDVETFWTNRRDANRMNFTLQSIFSPSALNFPSRPDYIVQHAFGITKADVNVRVTKFNNEEKYNQVLNCNGVTNDAPIKEQLYRCDTSIDNFNIRFDSGDTYSVIFRAENGGFRILDNNGVKQYYTGRSTTRKIDLKFDTEIPYHCTDKSECTYPVSDMMSVQNDVTKVPIQISWRGWKDQLSRVARYALEVFELEKGGDGTLKEPYTDLVPNPVPITIREFNETTEAGSHSFTYRPNKPGVYSCILEINDRANNSAYVRRFVIYDPISSLTSDESNPFYATSGNSIANYEWQNTNPDTFSFSWKNHFLNKIHEDGNFLARIRLFPPSLDDGGDRNGYKRIQYDDTEGTRSRDAIPNERGIIKYDVAYNIGKDQSSPQVYQHQNYRNNSIKIFENQNLQDGNSFTIWVKAYDILGNTREERFILHYDSTRPAVSSEELRKNVGEDKMNFTSSVHILGASDPNSGVKRIKYRFKAQSTGRVINNREYEYLNPTRDESYCNTNPCDSNLPTGESFGKTIDLPFSNCHAMNVSDVSTETVTMEMDVYNSAGLYISRSLQITNLTSLRGVNDYFGPMEIRIAEQIGQTLKIMWDQAPSCYNIQGFEFTYSRANGQVIKSEIFHEVQNWVILNGVIENTGYHLRLNTLYGNDPNNPIRSVDSNFTFTIPVSEPPTSSPSVAIAAGVSSALIILIILVLVFLIFMVRTRRMKNPIERLRSMSTKSKGGPFIENNFDSVVTRPNNKSKAYNNRAYSQEFEDDVYYAENETPLRYQIVRSRITFEEEIARGKFAIIYKAKYLKDNSSNTVVAKTMKENPTQNDIETMHAKVNFYAMKIGEHPNVLKFIGVVDDDVLGRFMVLEYCENGQLKEYLKANKHRVNDEMHEKLYRFACGICKGMNYLASQGVVHRRLAARNILLTFLLETKITGFGPEPRENDGSDTKTERVPIKWVAPECIKTTKHATEKSDVWSYGVVLWEIFSMGEAPYDGIKSMELELKLKKGLRLKKPEHCDDVFYKIMKRCWTYESEKRPNFEEILDELQTLFTGNIDGDEYYYSQNGLYDNRK